MSRIFGYIGKEDCKDIIIEGIDAMYRGGNENMGIAILQEGELCSSVCTGKAAKLYENSYNASHIGIAATTNNRTITPCCNNLFAVAMDGDIQNRSALISSMKIPFAINSDEELLLAMLCTESAKDNLQLMLSASTKINGCPSFAFISENGHAIYVKRGDSPLVIGIGDEGNYVSSELVPLLNKCSKYIELQPGQMARITESKIYIYDKKAKKQKLQPRPMPSTSFLENTYTYDEELINSFAIIKRCFKQFYKNGELCFDDVRLNRRSIDRLQRIIITGNGDDLDIARASAYNMELMCDIEAIAIPDYELMNTRGVITKSTLVIAISHYGEDMHTALAVRRAIENGAYTIAVTCNKLSHLARLCKGVIVPSISFTAQEYNICGFCEEYFALALFSIYLGGRANTLSPLYISVATKMAEMLHGKQTTLGRVTPDLEIIAREMQCYQAIYFTGYQIDEALASYTAGHIRAIDELPTYAMPLFDLMHTCKPQLKSSMVVAIISTNADLNIIVPALKAIKGKCQKLAVFTTEGYSQDFDFCDYIATVGDSIPLFNPITINTTINKAMLLAKTDSQQLDEKTA